MALFIRQDNQRSELQERIATELREKLKESAGPIQMEEPEKSEHLKGHETRHPGLIIAVLLVVLLIAVVVWASTLR